MAKPAMWYLLLVLSAGVCNAARPMQAPAQLTQNRLNHAAALPRSSSSSRQLLQAKTPLLGLDTTNKVARVLAFGDSITEGWIQSAWAKVPWSPRVEQRLRETLGSGWNVEVVNGGVGSAGVLDRLNDEFRQRLADARSSGRPYHYITFEAGINDLLLQNKNAPEIFERMKELWALANAEGSTVVVIPTLPTNVRGEREQQREALTAKVREYIAQQRSAGNKGLFLLDLEKPFDYWALSPEWRQQVFDDGVHMTVYGYELLGNLVYQGLVNAMGLSDKGGADERSSMLAKAARNRAATRAVLKAGQRQGRKP